MKKLIQWLAKVFGAEIVKEVVKTEKVYLPSDGCLSGDVVIEGDVTIDGNVDVKGSLLVRGYICGMDVKKVYDAIQ